MLNHRDEKLIKTITSRLVKLGEPVVKPLLNALANKKVKMTDVITEMMGNLKSSQTVELLISQLKHPTWDSLIIESAGALGKIGDTRAIPHLIEALQGSSVSKRHASRDALIKFGKQASDQLLAAFSNKGNHEWIRENAAQALGYIGEVRAVEMFIQALTDSPSMRISIIRALGRLRDAKAVQPLIKLLNHGDAYTREIVVLSLGEIGHPASVKPLLKMLEDKEWDVRRKASIALGNIGDPQAVDPILMLLKNDKESRVRSGAAKALGKIKDPRTIQPLITTALRDIPSVRGDAVLVLREFDDPEIIPHFISALKDEQESNIREAAAIALYRIGDDRAIEPLILALSQDKEKKVRDWAAQALGRIGNKRAVEPLIIALKKETDENVKYEIMNSLGLIKDPRAVEPLISILNEKGSTIKFVANKALIKITGQDFKKDKENWQKWWQKNKSKFIKY